MVNPFGVVLAVMKTRNAHSNSEVSSLWRCQKDLFISILVGCVFADLFANVLRRLEASVHENTA